MLVLLKKKNYCCCSPQISGKGLSFIFSLIAVAKLMQNSSIVCVCKLSQCRERFSCHEGDLDKLLFVSLLEILQVLLLIDVCTDQF